MCTQHWQKSNSTWAYFAENLFISGFANKNAFDFPALCWLWLYTPSIQLKHVPHTNTMAFRRKSRCMAPAGWQRLNIPPTQHTGARGRRTIPGIKTKEIKLVETFSKSTANYLRSVEYIFYSILGKRWTEKINPLGAVNKNRFVLFTWYTKQNWENTRKKIIQIICYLLQGFGKFISVQTHFLGCLWRFHLFPSSWDFPTPDASFDFGAGSSEALHLCSKKQIICFVNNLFLSPSRCKKEWFFRLGSGSSGPERVEFIFY